MIRTALLGAAVAGVLIAFAPGQAQNSSWNNFPSKAPPKGLSPSEQRGLAVYEARCTACHGPENGQVNRFGARMPGTQALKWKYKGETPALLTERKDLTPEIVTYFVRNGVMIMPAFRKTEISDSELKDLANYLAHKKAK